ncbi:alpha/beta hydrolase [Pseudoclavibacter endophyticus]|uniref:Alpha/beta hydrolase n=2 Tax=Pseudoclavibacter endophyticus TaxID=1778590 RepID=A0A6H9WPB4_9MICO|nr:alpha/beta hydrolase [Pseudoclavibacter endophyticus]
MAAELARELSAAAAGRSPAVGAVTGATVGVEPVVPRFPADDMSYGAWAAVARAELGRLGERDAVFAHSFSASTLLKLVSEERIRAVPPIALLAPPEWTPDGWNVADYAFDGPEPLVSITLHHCTDDEIVPFAHMALLAARLPRARVVEHPAGGHSFDGRLGAVAADYASVLASR